jgi:hypothetical protein
MAVTLPVAAGLLETPPAANRPLADLVRAARAALLPPPRRGRRLRTRPLGPPRPAGPAQQRDIADRMADILIKADATRLAAQSPAPGTARP